MEAWGLKIKELASFDRFVHGNTLIILGIIAYFLWQTREEMSVMGDVMLDIQNSQIEHEGLEGHAGMVIRNDEQESALLQFSEQVNMLSAAVYGGLDSLQNQLVVNQLINERRDIRDAMIRSDIPEDQLARYNDRLYDIEIELDIARRR